MFLVNISQEREIPVRKTVLSYGPALCHSLPTDVADVPGTAKGKRQSRCLLSFI
jgi:hypothetical protein